MTTRNRDKVLAFLEKVWPADASNAEIVSRTGIRPHQQVFALTRELMREGLIKGIQGGKDWRFALKKAITKGAAAALSRSDFQASMSGASPAAEFEALARKVMSAHYGTSLKPRRVAGVPKIFDLVSPDGRIIGDAKFYTLVRGERLPSAKFSIISEYVWLLEKAGAEIRFLVFGNDRRVPQQWLERYGTLTRTVEFYFLDREGAIRSLNGSESPKP